MSRRTRGATPFDVNDLYALATVLDVPISAFFEGLEKDHSEYRRGLGLGSNKQNYWTLPRSVKTYPTSRVAHCNRPDPAHLAVAA